MCFGGGEVGIVGVDEFIHSVHFLHPLQGDTFFIWGGNRFCLDFFFFFWDFILHDIQESYWILFSLAALCLKLNAEGNQFSCPFARHSSKSQLPSSLLTVQHKIHFPWMLSLRNKSDRFCLLLSICAAAAYIPEVLTNCLEAALVVHLSREMRIIF